LITHIVISSIVYWRVISVLLVYATKHIPNGVEPIIWKIIPKSIQKYVSSLQVPGKY
jgi:hypothetical protein